MCEIANLKMAIQFRLQLFYQRSTPPFPTAPYAPFLSANSYARA